MDDLKLKATRERVAKALTLCNQKTVAVSDGRGGTLIVTLETDRFSFDETHLNAEARRDLDQAITKFASGEADEDAVRSAIRDLRDASEVAIINGAMYVREPSVADFDRLQRLFDLPSGERVVPLHRDDDERMKWLLDRATKLFSLMLDQHDFATEDSARGITVFSDLYVTQAMFKRLCLKGMKLMSSETAKLYQVYGRSDMTAHESTGKPLTKIALDSVLIEKDVVDEIDLHALTDTFAEKREAKVAVVTHEHVCIECEKAFICTRTTHHPTICEPCDAALAREKLEARRAQTQIVETKPIKMSIVEYEGTLFDVTNIVAEASQPAQKAPRDLTDTHTTENPLEGTETGLAGSFDTEQSADAKERSTIYVGTKIVEASETVELDDEDKKLAQYLDDDGEPPDEVEHEIEVQDSLFDLGRPEKIERRKMFTDTQMIDAAFKWHRQKGFPYRDMSPAMGMRELQKLAETEGEALISTRLAYQLADTFHKHRLHASANGMKSPIESFHDDKKLRKAITLELKLGGKPRIFAGGMMTLVNGTQACSNFRPGFAAYLYRQFCPDNATVLDTSTGYGGRLLGAFASQKVAHYIGIDPNVPTYEANIKMIEELHLRSSVDFTLINLPAEDVDHDLVREKCDFSFTSPPYFAKEIYSQDETQSWRRYGTGDAWRDGFLRKMLELTFVALKHDTHAIVNIADVTVKGKRYPLADWTIELGQAVGFEYLRTEKFPMMARFGANMADGVAFEPVIVFKKA